jgi:hypothetical protein
MESEIQNPLIICRVNRETRDNMIGRGLFLLGCLFISGVPVEFPSLPGSVFSLGKFLSGAKKLFVATGRGSK